MKTPLAVANIYLMPGDCHFVERHHRLQTLLGSCVSVTVWHPQHHVGGMCHFLLPHRGALPRREAMTEGLFADSAIEFLVRKIRATGLALKEFEAKLIGGGDIFPGQSGSAALQIGQKNIQAARQILARCGLICQAEHCGGDGYRNLVFEVWSGKVMVGHKRLRSGMRGQA